MKASTNIQVINGQDGKPAFVVIPYEQYQRQMQADRDLTPQEVVKKIFIEKMSPVRAWREHLGLTQQELATRLDISQSAYAQQEISENLRKSSLLKIANAMGIDVELLDI